MQDESPAKTTLPEQDTALNTAAEDAASAPHLETGVQPLFMRLRDHSHWVHVTGGEYGTGVFFCPTNDPPEMGARVHVSVTFVKGPRFELNGVVTMRRYARGSRTKPGVGVRVGPGCRQTFDFISCWARGQTRDRRGPRRLSLRLLVCYWAKGQRRINFTRNLSRDGLYIQSSHVLKQNSAVKLKVFNTDGSKSLKLRGIVSHCDLATGMGVQLVFEDEEAQRRYMDFLDALEGQFLSQRMHAP